MLLTVYDFDYGIKDPLKEGLGFVWSFLHVLFGQNHKNQKNINHRFLLHRLRQKLSVQVIYWQVCPGETGKGSGGVGGKGAAGHSGAEVKPGTRLGSSPEEGLTSSCRSGLSWPEVKRLAAILPCQSLAGGGRWGGADGNLQVLWLFVSSAQLCPTVLCPGLWKQKKHSRAWGRLCRNSRRDPRRSEWSTDQCPLYWS